MMLRIGVTDKDWFAAVSSVLNIDEVNFRQCAGGFAFKMDNFKFRWLKKWFFREDVQK